jgi:N-acetylglucosaminyldiphosphoundecaprenol N-acetyl-beta-D-mannosaminyltransferase
VTSPAALVDLPIEVVGRVPFRVTTLHEAVDSVLERAASGSPGVAIRLANSYCVALADKDAAYGALLEGAGVNFPDGSPVVWAINSQRGKVDDQAGLVRGPSFFVESLDRGQRLGIRHYFLGGTPESLPGLLAEARRRFPDLEIAGSYAPPFQTMTEEAIDEFAAMVRQAGPHLVWVGLGAPKQDYVAQGLTNRTGLCALGVGAAFGIFAGETPEAPRWLQGTGLEWVFRLTTEPRRLWRRYLFGNARFLSVVTRDLIGRILSR